MKRTTTYLLGILMLIGAGTAAAFIPTRFTADLSGSQEVPAVTTTADGRGSIKIEEADDEIRFKVRVDDMTAVTQAHLHCAPTGQNGPIVAFLSGLIPGGFDQDGLLAAATLKDANIVATAADCQLNAIADIDDLVEAIRAGNIYMNVHTIAHPTGEIRGQLE